MRVIVRINDLYGQYNRQLIIYSRGLLQIETNTMIKTSQLKNKQKNLQQKFFSLKLQRLRQELSRENFDLTDQNCMFYINPNMCIKSNFIAIQIKVKPLVGLYKDIDFVPTLFIDDISICSQPRVFNNRRIFHPNINPYTLEIAVPEIISWNPTNNIIFMLRRLKYTIIQPNGTAIPNNNLSKRAAYLYKIDRQNFRNYIIQYCPTVLENLTLKQKNQNNDRMEDERIIKKFIKIQQILPTSRLKLQSESNLDDGFQFLNKRMSEMKIISFEETKEKLSNQAQTYSNSNSNLVGQVQPIEYQTMEEE